MDGVLWEKFILDLARKKNSPVLIPILKKTSFSDFTGDRFFIACDNSGMKFFLETRKTQIEQSLSETAGKPIKITFIIKEGVKKKRFKSSNDTPLLQFELNKEKTIKKSGLLEKFTFDNFAVSSSNQVAYSAALAVCDHPGVKYNPLFIYGGVGVGKTHLIQAIANKVLDKDIARKTLYCSSEDFTNDLIEFIQAKNTALLRKKYRSLDLFLIDDIQFIAGKNYVQEEFFHTFNSIIRRGGQIILTSDRPPKEIKKLEDRLISRFSGGLTIDIQKPDFELKTAILLIKAKERGINIDVEAAKLIVERTDDVRELEGRLLEIYMKAPKKEEKITPQIVEEEFEKKTSEVRNKLAPPDVIKFVCSYYNVKPSRIKNNTRKENVVLPRQIIMFLLRNVLKLKLEEIAFILKKKDHTTIIHGVDKITNMILKNPTFKEDVGRIISSLSLST